MSVHLEGRPEEYASRVLSSTYHRYHVCSDNAMIDSGDGRFVEVWDDAAQCVRTLEFHLGRGGNLLCTVDATADVVAKAEMYKAASRWMDECREASRCATMLAPGKRVSVSTSCRKVPKDAGVLTILRLGDGQYGPYADLRAADGKEYRYVDRRWLSVEEADRYSVSPCPWSDPDGKLQSLVRDCRAILDDSSGIWHVVADRMEELGMEMAWAIRAVVNQWQSRQR